jgi:diphosphomevalonate decarboxylase
MKPNTLEIIQKIWEFRVAENSNICFTLDAGANVHVLYPFNEKEKINRFIESELAQYCQNKQYILDVVGHGAKKG